MSRKMSARRQSERSGNTSEFQMLEPRLFLSTTVLYREGGGTGYVNTTFDDATITGTVDTADGSNANVTLRNSTGAAYKVGLLAVKDLFTLLPKDSGQGTINITSAKIHLFRYQGSSADTIYIDRMTSNWLTGSAGTNEADTTFKHRDKSADLHWTGGSDFSSSDYTTTHEVSGAWVNGYNEEKVFTITSLVQDIYSTSTNYGFVFRTSVSASTDDFRSSENTLAYRPALEITYDYVYDLAVNSGTGDGTYTSGSVVSVAADAPAPGYVFSVWTGNTAGLADIYDPTTTYTMSTSDASITATYIQTNHALTVNSGTGDGSYASGTVVGVAADAAPTGKVFSCWTGDTQYLANVNAASTTFTMPGVDASITATYSWINRTLTINNGTGDGSTYHYGEVVNIAADPQSGYAFYKWSGASGTFADVNDATTTFTMPNSDVTIFANCSPFVNQNTKLREGALTGYTNVTVDDAHLTGGGDTADGSGENITLRAGSGSAYQVGLMGVEDLFSQIPATSGGSSITITSATLHLYRYNGTSGDTIYVDRMTSDWMTGSAGTNEADVTFQHRDKSANLHWAGGADFSSSDYTTSGEASHAWSDVYNGDVAFDVTSILQSIYSTGNNYGLVLRTTSTGGLAFRSSENSNGATVHPYIEISYSYGLPTPMHTLSVTGASSSGTGSNAPGYYWENQGVTITADTPAAGKAFNMWIGDIGYHNAFTTLSKDCTPRAQDEDITPGGTIEVGDKFVLTCNGDNLTVVATGTTVDQVCRDMNTAINGVGSGSNFYKMTSELRTSNNIAYCIRLLAKTAGVGWTMTVATTENNGAAADGQTVSIYHRIDNHIPPASNIAASPSTYQMPAYDAAVKSSYRDSTQPLDWWPAFDAFSQSSFGAQKEALTYDYAEDNYGSSNIAMRAAGQYIYASEDSAYLGFETTLPAKTRLEYGTTQSYGTSVYHDARYNYEHGYSVALSAGTTYYYRLTATDELNNSVTTTGSFTTATPSEAGRTVRNITSYNSTADWAVTLDQANSLYVLQTDIVADKGGIRITASNITLDLNGHTIIYDNATGTGVTPDENAPAGVNCYQAAALSNIKILNGTVKQGLGYHGSAVGSMGYNPIMIKNTTNILVAGMNVEYSGTQMTGIQANYASGSFHHNTILDHGSVIINRMAVFAAINIGTGCTVNNNLILRTRHGGIFGSGQGADTIYNNEVYTDSSDTNSIGIGMYHDTGWSIYNNYVFGSGYELRGLSINSQTSGASIHNNFVHLRAQDLDFRSAEYEALSEVSGIDCRWNCFDNTIEANYFIVGAQDKGEAQAIWYNSDQADVPNGRQATHNIKYLNNVAKATYFNADSTKLAAIRITGDGVQFAEGGETDAYGRPIRQVYFSGNRIISNYCTVGFGALGEMYIKGKYAYFGPYDANNDGSYEYGGNTLVKDTSISHDYYTLKIEGGSNTGHVFIDNAYENGASASSVLFISGASTTDFTIGWSLRVNTAVGAVVNVYNAAAPSVSIFTGTVGAGGYINITDASGTPMLYQYKNVNGTSTNYSYNINSYYSGTNHWYNGLSLDALNEAITL